MIEAAAAALHTPPAPHEAAGHDRDETAPAGVPARPPLGARRADALAEIAFSGSPRTQVVVHVDQDALVCTATAAADRAGATCELEAGPAIPR